MSTIREIARELNLSHTTVSRVLNTRNDQAISLATRERILTAAKVMGYQPHAAARALATGRSQIVALLMHYLYTSFHAEVVHEVEQTLRRSGYQVLVATIDKSDTENDREHLRQLSAPVDGYLAFESAAYVSSLLTRSAGTGGKTAPVVAMGGHNMGDVADSAGFDLAAGADMAMDHLIGLGRRRIAFVSERRKDPRIDRYREKMREAGLTEQFLEVPTQERGDVRTAIRGYFDGGGAARTSALPDALFCFNDEVAIGAYRGLRDVGIGIGTDIALVGFDGIKDGIYLDTPITTVALPIQRMCHLAWEMLQTRMSTPDAAPMRTTLRPSLVIRESTTPAIASGLSEPAEAADKVSFSPTP